MSAAENLSTRFFLHLVSTLQFSIFDEVRTFTLGTRLYQTHTPQGYDMPFIS
jgi:hypothetical protein